jgi:hypothetical protein
MKRIYYGWVIVALGFVSMAFWLGVNSTFSVFYATLLDEFAWQRAESAGVMATSQIVYTQSYRLAFLLAIVSALLSAVLIWIAAPRKASRFSG